MGPNHKQHRGQPSLVTRWSIDPILAAQKKCRKKFTALGKETSCLGLDVSEFVVVFVVFFVWGGGGKWRKKMGRCFSLVWVIFGSSNLSEFDDISST